MSAGAGLGRGASTNGAAENWNRPSGAVSTREPVGGRVVPRRRVCENPFCVEPGRRNVKFERCGGHGPGPGGGAKAGQPLSRRRCLC